MNNIPFNSDIDKITERELVYDIVERSTLGKDLKENNVLFWKKGTFLTDIFKRLVSFLPLPVTLHLYDVQIQYIHIGAGQKAGVCTFSNLSSGEILLAYSQQTQMDVKDTIVISGDKTRLTCTLNTTVPYHKDEYIKVYAW